MRRWLGSARVLFYSIGVIIFVITLFSLCYRWDNKYTRPGLQVLDGVLQFGAEEIVRSQAVFLIHGWEIYRDKLLTPQDFRGLDFNLPKEDIFIGQYGGFEGSDYSRSPHGSATYRLRISLPATPTNYVLELPEVFSAYRLYINGVMHEQFGNPDPGEYDSETGCTIVTFVAQDLVEIIFAVSDFSHIYSGLVYPPTFGASAAVLSLQQTRLVLRAAIDAIALALAVFFMIVGFFSGKNRIMLLFGLLCLCFVGYTSYPVVKAVSRSGMIWYNIENFCFVSMFFLVIQLQRSIFSNNNVSARVASACGVAVCIVFALRPLLPGGVLELLALYSLLIGLYKWGTAFFLTISMVHSLKSDTRYGRLMIAGILTFDCALVMDRLLPLYEPVLFGWFLEIAGFALVLSLGCIVVQEAVYQYRDRFLLATKLSGIERFVDMQRNYYPVMLQGMEEARHARHDLRHHLSALQSLMATKSYLEMERYLNKYALSMNRLVPLNYSENFVVDVILRHFADLAIEQGIQFQVNATIPEELVVDDVDLCLILSNVLENALEACTDLAGERVISVALKQTQTRFVLLVDNSFDGVVEFIGDRFLSRKREKQEGIGLASIEAIVKRYGGSATFAPHIERKIFTSEIVL